MKQVSIYTDGACSGNPGPGGWAAILIYQEVEKELSGGEKQTTNNRTGAESGSLGDAAEPGVKARDALPLGQGPRRQSVQQPL